MEVIDNINELSLEEVDKLLDRISNLKEMAFKSIVEVKEEELVPIRVKRGKKNSNEKSK